MQSLIRSKSAGLTGGRGTAGAGPGRDLLYRRPRGRPGGSHPGGPAADWGGALFPRPPPPFGCQTLVQALARATGSPCCRRAVPAGQKGGGGPASARGGGLGQRSAVSGLRGGGCPLALVAPVLSPTGGAARPSAALYGGGGVGQGARLCWGGVTWHCPLSIPSRSSPGPARRGRHLHRRFCGGWGCGGAGFSRR